ncbi:glutathione synthase [Lactarius hengduanensis]|nr:glutathione synthase [Lactarius hengduanensis]
MSAFTAWPPNVTTEQLDQLTLLATTWALSHSLIYLPPFTLDKPLPPVPESAIHAPLSLFPTPVPRQLFKRALALQRAYNTLYARIALDTAFLDETMGSGGVADLRDGGVPPPLHLGIFRSDYLLHQPTSGERITLKQVEFNTISVSFGCLSQQVAGMHRYLSESTSYFGVSPLLSSENLPPNDTINGLAKGLAEAHRAYGVSNAHILVVVQPDERNVFDQRLLEYQLFESHGIHVSRRTFTELGTTASISPSRALLVVYYRTGYSPVDYASPADYATRALLERSRAAQCPSLALQLAGGKKVQEVLTRPGVLERFLAPSEGAELVRESWTRPYAAQRELVLKPQREGGGNNIYRDKIPQFVAQLPERERAAWIAMELIRPPRGVGAHLVRSGAGRVSKSVVSELGVFGWALFGEGREVKEEQAGWLVRTKAEDVDEGGVAAGFGVLDSVMLVD